MTALACALHATATAQQPASDPAAVLLRVPDCLGVMADDVRGLVALELAPRLRVATRDEPHALVCTVRCGSERAHVVVDDPARAAPLELTVDLAAAPERARTRLLALAIAELIATSRLERAPPGGPVAETEAASELAANGRDEPSQQNADEPRRVRLWLGPGLSRAADPALTLLGADLGASYALGPALLLGGVEARWGTTDALAAELHMQSYSASVALAPRLVLGAVELAAGPGLRAGYARLEGRPTQAGLEGRALGGAWFGPSAVASAALHVTRWGALRAGVELGYVLKPVRGLDAQDQRLLELRGLWLSASLGAALRLP